MEVTPLGMFLVVLGTVFFFAKSDLLYWCAIFFVPFSSTAVVNVPSSSNFSALQPWMFFGILWIASQASSVMRAKKYWYRQHTRVSVRKLLIFLLVALLSLVMPLWIDGRLSIESESPGVNESHPLYFGLRHITQFLYLAYGAAFAIFLAVKNANLNQFRKTLRVFLSSSVFVGSWGLMQWFCYQYGLKYPAFIFNTNKNDMAMGFATEFKDLEIPRVSAVATEPSILAQYLLIVFVIALFAVLGRQKMISALWDRLALVLSLLLLFLTTSSTAYLGLGLLIPISLLSFFMLGKLRVRQIMMSLSILAIACFVIYSRTSTVQDLADKVFFSKADSYSGLERLNSVLLAAGYFFQYPLLGVGWGSVTSHDLIFKLLANSGIAGLVAFAMFLSSLGSGLWKSVARTDSGQHLAPWSYWGACMLVASLIFVLTSMVSEFTYVFGHLWFVFGMSLAVPLGLEFERWTAAVRLQQVGS